MITKADGGKFGKTEQGNIWLDPKRTTPYQFYQFWLNASDADAEKWIRIFTFLTLEEIEETTNTHNQDPGQRLLQKRLAEEVTMFIHGKAELEKAVETTQKLFSSQTSSAESLSVEDLESLEGVVKSDYDKTKLNSGIDIVGFLAETNVFPSKGEARKTIQAGGITINRKKVSDVHMTINNSMLLHNKYILVQKGKKNYYLVKLV